MDQRTITLHGGRTAPAEARTAVRDLLGPMLAREAMERVALMTSETVSNAVSHASGDAAMRLSIASHAARVRVAVEDGRGVGAGTSEQAWGDGLGMMIVSRLSDRWGAGPSEHGTEVWFEVDLPSAAS